MSLRMPAPQIYTNIATIPKLYVQIILQQYQNIYFYDVSKKEVKEKQ